MQLVWPEPYAMYLLGEHGRLHDFGDFLEYKELEDWVPMVRMRDFLAEEGLTGRLKDGLLPPGNKTVHVRQRPLGRYLRSVSRPMSCRPETHVMGFDVDKDPDRFKAFRGARKQVPYGPELQAEKVIHFTSAFDGAPRWLTHWCVGGWVNGWMLRETPS
jgi:hypothetical protein